MVYTRCLISKSSSFSTFPLLTVPSEPVIISITVSFTFISFSVFLQGQGTYLSFRFLLVITSEQPERQSQLFKKFYFLSTINRSGRLTKIRGSVSVSKSQRSLCVSFSRMESGLYISSSSSSCRAGSTDIPDHLSPLFPIVHRLWQVFWTTSRILE